MIEVYKRLFLMIGLTIIFISILLQLTPMLKVTTKKLQLYIEAVFLVMIIATILQLLMRTLKPEKVGLIIIGKTVLLLVIYSKIKLV